MADQKKAVVGINVNWLCNSEDYMMLCMLPIFGQGLSQFAGVLANPVVQAREGMRAVITWWCENGGPTCGEPDYPDALAQVARRVAEQIGYESSDINLALQELKPWVLGLKCKPSARRARMFPRLRRK